MKPLIYLAGPYTAPDPMVNINVAVKIADSLLEVCVPIVPHLTGFWHVISPKPYDEWLRYDLGIMRRCDAVYRWGGDSSGADLEVQYARDEGIPVFFSEDAVRSWIERGQ